MFAESFNGISRKFQGCLKEDGRGLKEYFKEVQSEFQRSYKVFQESFRGVPRKLLGCFKKVLTVFQGRLKGVSMEF